jgi:hypothetical protein
MLSQILPALAAKAAFKELQALQISVTAGGGNPAKTDNPVDQPT